MADFNSAGKWLKIGFLLAVNAMVLFLFALVTNLGIGFNDDGIEAMMVISIMVCIIGVFLTFCVVFLDELNGNMIVKIVVGVLLIAGGLFIIIGIAIWGGKYDDHNGDPPAYPTTLGVFAALMFILGGIFFILDVVTGGSGGGSK